MKLTLSFIFIFALDPLLASTNWDHYLQISKASDVSQERKAMLFIKSLEEGANKIPEELKKDIQVIDGPKIDSFKVIKKLLKNLSNKVLLTSITKNGKREIPSNILKLGSGGAKIRVFKKYEHKKFFISLFQRVHNSFPDIKLNPLNFFHGHFVKNFIIFHAYEYPSDLEPFKSRQIHSKHPHLKLFSSSNKFYGKRNLIYSFNLNVIYRLNTKNLYLSHLIQSPAFKFYPGLVRRANTLQEDHFGVPGFDVNYFFLNKKYYLFMGQR